MKILQDYLRATVMTVGVFILKNQDLIKHLETNRPIEGSKSLLASFVLTALKVNCSKTHVKIRIIAQRYIL